MLILGLCLSLRLPKRIYFLYPCYDSAIIKLLGQMVIQDSIKAGDSKFDPCLYSLPFKNIKNPTVGPHLLRERVWVHTCGGVLELWLSD